VKPARYPKRLGEVEILRLRATVADLRKRVRLARAQLTTLVNRNLDSTDAIITESNVFDVLDLRKPVQTKNPKSCPESSLVAWGARLSKRGGR
jgi:outer membrane protein TolC